MSNISDLNQRIMVFSQAFQDLIKVIADLEKERRILQQEVDSLSNEINNIKKELKKKMTKSVQKASS